MKTYWGVEAYSTHSAQFLIFYYTWGKGRSSGQNCSGSSWSQTEPLLYRSPCPYINNLFIDGKGKAKMKLSLCLTKHYAMELHAFLTSTLDEGD